MDHRPDNSGLRVFALAPEQIEATWKDYRHLFEQFERETGEVTAAQIKEQAKASQMQVWGLQDRECVCTVVATQINREPRGLLCDIRAAVGPAPPALQALLLDEICSWAKRMGYVGVRLWGRPRGWLRRFRGPKVVAEWAFEG